MAIVEVKLSIKDEAAKETLLKTGDKIRSIFNQQIASQGESLQEIIVQMLAARGLTLGVIESSSAGQIATMLNSVPGDSDCLITGFYYRGKEEIAKLFGQDQETSISLEEKPFAKIHEGTAALFLEKTGADCVLATSQAETILDNEIDRPGKKLVISCGTKDSFVSREYLIAREYDDFLVFVSVAALDLLRRFLLKYPIDNPYYFDELTRSQLK